MMSCNLDQIQLQFRKMPQIAIIWATWKGQNKIRVILNFKPILSATLLFTPLSGINPPDCHFFIGLRAVLFFSKLPQYIKNRLNETHLNVLGSPIQKMLHRFQI